MNEQEIKESAEKHWEYTAEVISRMLELSKYLYVEAMIHGYKHGVTDTKEEVKPR